MSRRFGAYTKFVKQGYNSDMARQMSDELYPPTKEDLKYERSRELFTTFDDCKYDIKDIKFCGQPSKDKIDKFFNENNINVSVGKVYTCFSPEEELEFVIDSESE